MIRVGTPYIETKECVSRLCANINIDGDSNVLWIEVQDVYSQYLCYERSDAFVLGLLHYAMKYGHDIASEAPLTDRLYLQLTEQFLPAFSKANNLRKVCNISAPLAVEVEHPDGGIAVGTGCSCGVDSMHVYATHKDLTHGCVWNVHGVTFDETDETRNNGWNNLKRQAERFTAEAGVELVICNSNFDRGCFSNLQFDGSISYGNLFFIFALQKLWKRYYVASGYDITEFSLECGVNADPAHYEYLLFAFCSLKNITVAIDGVAQTRIQKVVDLLKYPLSRRFLNVCWCINEDGKNCTCYCAKCIRTILELEALGEIDKYAQVFDVEYFKTHKEEYLAEWWRGLWNKDDYAIELKPYFSRKKWGALIRFRASVIFVRKAFKKLLRFGKKRQGYFKPRG